MTKYHIYESGIFEFDFDTDTWLGFVPNSFRWFNKKRMIEDEKNGVYLRE